jgi:hypothetical protein
MRVQTGLIYLALTLTSQQCCLGNCLTLLIFFAAKDYSRVLDRVMIPVTIVVVVVIISLCDSAYFLYDETPPVCQSAIKRLGTR